MSLRLFIFPFCVILFILSVIIWTLGFNSFRCRYRREQEQDGRVASFCFFALNSIEPRFYYDYVFPTLELTTREQSEFSFLLDNLTKVLGIFLSLFFNPLDVVTSLPCDCSKWHDVKVPLWCRCRCIS